LQKYWYCIDFSIFQFLFPITTHKSNCYPYFLQNNSL
jgi:hypothetical protein